MARTPIVSTIYLIATIPPLIPVECNICTSDPKPRESERKTPRDEKVVMCSVMIGIVLWYGKRSDDGLVDLLVGKVSR